MSWSPSFSKQVHLDTVDGPFRNPARKPVDMHSCFPLFTGSNANHHPTRWLYLVTLVISEASTVSITPNGSTNGSNDLLSQAHVTVAERGSYERCFRGALFYQPTLIIVFEMCENGISHDGFLIHGTRGIVYLAPGARVRPSTNHWVSYQPTIGYLRVLVLGFSFRVWF